MSARWEAQRERSNPLMLRIMLWVALHLGRCAARLLLYPISLYFLVTAGAVRSASRSYLARVLGHQPGWRDLFRHIFSFSAVSLDRLFLLSGHAGEFQVLVHDPEALLQNAAGGKGSIVLVSHFGSFDVMRVPGAEWKKLRVRVVMDGRQARMAMAMLRALNPGFAADVIDAAQPGPQLALSLKNALDAGDVVGLMADRARAGEPTVAVSFLGGAAQLPLYPWQLASVLKAPVFLGFGVYRGGRRYDLHFEKFSDGLSAPRGRRQAAAQGWAQQYAGRLEHYVRMAPDNWFNFYDFWADVEPEGNPADPHAG
jgi:predicted LPLAT superfamily acyltransferase